MTSICPAAIHLCALRVTRLDAVGNPTPGPNNMYVSNNPLSLQVTPVIEAGADKTLVGGCDCIVATYRGTDKLKRFDFTVDTAVLEPGLLEMMTGGSAITVTGDVVGMWYPRQISCSNTQQPNVAVEGWQTLWQDDHAYATPYKYIHWIWPSTSWQIGQHNLQNEFVQPQVTGFSRGNTAWGVGPYHDAPEAVQSQGGFFFTNTIPTAACGYQTTTIT